MSVDISGNLNGNITPETMLDFIKKTFDKNATSSIKLWDYGDEDKITEGNPDVIKERYDDSGHWIEQYGQITFKYKKKTYGLFYMYANTNQYENLNYFSEYGLEDMVKAETTYISIYKHEKAVEIIRKIVSNFGGWIAEENDDNIPYYYIKKGTNIKFMQLKNKLKKSKG